MLVKFEHDPNDYIVPFNQRVKLEINCGPYLYTFTLGWFCIEQALQIAKYLNRPVDPEDDSSQPLAAGFKAVVRQPSSGKIIVYCKRETYEEPTRY